MALSRVEITSEVFYTCVSHALTTEAEEIMGLLLGDVSYDERGTAVARIWVAMPQIRTDRRKDRVEASSEQLARASEAAEQLSEQGKRRTRVIGWYHSHPHITVLPSHVDVRTQGMYQGLDDGFIGLIFSVFNQDNSDMTQRVQMTAFQSQLSLAPSTPQQARGSWDFDSPAMAAAISASVADARAAAAAEEQWVQRKVPLAVVPSASHTAEATLSDLVALCKVLFEEEQHSYRQAVQAATDRDGMIDPLTAIHQAAEYQQHLARLIELVLAPSLHTLRAQRAQRQLQQQQLCEFRDSLVMRSPAWSQVPPLSPQRQAASGFAEGSSQKPDHPSASQGGPASGSASTAQPASSQLGHPSASADTPAAAPFLPPSMGFDELSQLPLHALSAQAQGAPAASGQSPSPPDPEPRIVYHDWVSQEQSTDKRAQHQAMAWPEPPTPADWEDLGSAAQPHNGAEVAGPGPQSWQTSQPTGGQARFASEGGRRYIPPGQPHSGIQLQHTDSMQRMGPKRIENGLLAGSSAEVPRGVIPTVVDVSRPQSQANWPHKDPLDDVMAGFMAEFSVNKSSKH